MNNASAEAWLNKGWHHLSSGKLLYEANHYTDTIAVDLHYAVEVTLKSILAYENEKIIKTHDLIQLDASLKSKIDFSDDELLLLDKITTYHIKSAKTIMKRLLKRTEKKV